MPYYIKRKPKATTRTPTLSSAVQRLDRIFSLYIRLRDSKDFNYRLFRCISCGHIKPFDKADCGHFYSRRHLATRFDPDNAHAECSFCNRFSADHLIAYEANLKKKIGTRRFNLLSVRHNTTHKFSLFELEELTKHYKKLTSQLLHEKEQYEKDLKSQFNIPSQP